MKTQSQLRFGKILNKLTIKDVELSIENEIDESPNLEYARALEKRVVTT